MRSHSVAPAMAAALALLAPPASAEEDSTYATLQAAVSYVTSPDFRGFGVAGTVLGVPSRYFAAGGCLDLAYGTADALSYSFVSIMLAGVAQLRAPGPVMPYLEAKLGVAGVSTLEGDSYCEYATGIGVGAALGVEFQVTRRAALGVRGWTRMPAGGIGCKAMGGGGGFSTILLFGVGATVALRW